MSQPAHAWLSSDSPELLNRLSKRTEQASDCDVLVIGSGYGGAVAAARMAGCTLAATPGASPGDERPPARVWVVERGREYRPGSFPRRFSELPGHVRFSTQDDRPARGRPEGLFDVRIGDAVHVLLGNGLGGGSLINAGVMAEPDASVFGEHFPAELNAQTMAPWYAQAASVLQPQPVPNGQRPNKFGALDAMAQAAEGKPATPCAVTIKFIADAGRLPQALAACTHCGDCLTGCNQGAKASLDTNYLAMAYQQGAGLFCGVTVERIEPPGEPGGPWRVHWQPTAPELGRPDARSYQVRARQVVLAAGALGSTEILLRSRCDCFPLSNQLGQRFSTNGDMIAAVFAQAPGLNAAANQETDPSIGAAKPGARNVGPTITGMVAAAQAGQALTIQEFAVPGALGRVFGELVSTFGFTNLNLAGATANTSPDPLAASAEWVSSSGLYGLMGDDGAGGQLVLPSPEPQRRQAVESPTPDARLRIHWPGVGRLPIFAAQQAWLQRALGTDRVKLVPNPLWRNISHLLQADAAAPPCNNGGIITVHPLGGCSMGEHAGAGVVNSHGQVFRPGGDGKQVYPGLAVLDGAIVPRALGINPAFTIAALAERAVCDPTTGLLAAWGLQVGPAIQKRLPRRSLVQTTRTPARSGTEVRLSERLVGPLKIGGQAYWAALCLEDVVIPDLHGLLQSPKTKLPAARAHLALWPMAPGQDEFTHVPAAPARWFCTLDATVTLFAPGTKPASWREILYDLTVLSVAPAGQAPLKPTQQLQGIKQLGRPFPTPGPSGRMQERLLRQLTEVQLGPAPRTAAGRWGILKFDFDDQVDRGVALLQVTRQSSAPDHLADLAGLLLYTLRLYLKLNLSAFNVPPDYPHELIVQNLNSRYPGPVDGQPPAVQPVGRHGARLSRYQPTGPATRPPVLMIHGYGASGTTFSHPSIPISLVQYLLSRQREAWVLDLRSSIGHEPDDPGSGRPDADTFDEIALQDIPAAMKLVWQQTGQQPFDVVAHCIGAAMFCVAMLGHPDAHRQVHRAVLSQVGPIMRFSPMNRFRGFMASYLAQFLGMQELDNRPEYRRRRQADGTVAWERDAELAQRIALVDALLARYPYPDDDDEAAVAAATGVPFMRVRHRADAIFGHLMELNNLAPQTLRHFDAINGWVKVGGFAQTIHYARHGRLTNASGQGQMLRCDLLRQHFGFPVMLLHGRRNRVFDWQGSLASLKLLRSARAQGSLPPPRTDGQAQVWGDDQLQLQVLDHYGHQDCLVGKDAGQDVFPRIGRFLDAPNQAVPAHATSGNSGISYDLPWIGPVWGGLQHDGSLYRLKLVAHPRPERAGTAGWVLVPMPGHQPEWDQACGMSPTAQGSAGNPAAAFPNDNELAHDQTTAITAGALQIALSGAVRRFLVLMLHTDQLIDAVLEPAGQTQAQAPAASNAAPWVRPGRWLSATALAALRHWGSCADAAGTCPQATWQQACVELSDAVLAACERAGPDNAPRETPRAPLCLALASCQYPPGMLDEACAQASWQRLQDCLDDDRTPPQLLLAVGDQVYVDATAGAFDASAHAAGPANQVRKAYELAWRMPAFREVARRLPLYTMLDDHEICDAWQPCLGQPQPPRVAEALSAFERYQASLNPARSLGPGYGYSFSPAGALLLVLDTRSQRDARRAGMTAEGVDLNQACIVPEAVMAAVQDQLANADPRAVKFIVTPTPLLPLARMWHRPYAERTRPDGWGGYARSMLDLLSFIQRRKIQRVVLLSGDAHLSAVCRLRISDGPLVHAVVSSGLYAPWPFANADPGDFILPEDYILDRVLKGTITIQHGGRSVGLRYTYAKTSSANGLALISLSTVGADPQGRLTVRLLPAQGEEISYSHNFSHNFVRP